MNSAAATPDTAPNPPGLPARVAGFVRVLRDNGFTVGLQESADALRALQGLPLDRPGPVRDVLRCLFCARAEDWRRFDELFEAYWRGRNMRRAAQVSGQSGRRRQPRRGPGPEWPGQRLGAPDHAEEGGGDDSAEAAPHGRRGGASAAQSLSEVDLRHLHDEEALAEAHALAERLARRMRRRLTRRERLRRKGRRLDLRGTIHRSIARGGLPLDMLWRRRRERPLRLVVLLDVSGSMSQYSSFFLRFTYGVLDRFREAEAFVFHTRLAHISPALQEPSAQKAVERLSLIAQGWSGGTRIGESLAAFNRHHAARVIHGRTVVVIMSDGYDTGPPERLGAEMAALRRRARRVVWLNPMKGWAGYAPEAGGMRAALPHVDLFATAHNLKSLAELEPYLARV